MCLDPFVDARDDDDAPVAPPGGSGEGVRARMPCCDREHATVAFCVRCVRHICQRGHEGVGRCPKCREHVRVTPRGEVLVAENRGRCELCLQPNRALSAEQRALCVACAVGMRHPLRYECQRCGRAQRIAHPMWRYQPSPATFGTTTWACHVGCGEYTRWRVAPADLARVPLDDVPESWGVGEDALLAALREEVRALERTGGGDLFRGRGRRGREGVGPGEGRSGCVVQ